MIVSTRILSIHYSRCCYLTKTLTTSLEKYCHIGNLVRIKVPPFADQQQVSNPTSPMALTFVQID